MATTATRRHLTPVVVLGVVLLAGCAGLDGTPGTTDDPARSPTDTATGPSVDEERLRTDALAAIRAVESYRVAATQKVVTEGPRSRTVTVTDHSRIDRADRELRQNRTVTVAGQRVNSTQYVVNRTFYSRSDVYVRQYSSEWIRRNVSENFSRLWRRQDVLGQLRVILANASSVEVTGTEQVDGERTYRTRVNVTTTAFEAILLDVVGLDPNRTDRVNVTHVEYVYWLDVETARPLRTAAEVRYSARLDGRTVRQNVTTTARYDYGPVSVDLPEAADRAVNLSDPRLLPPASRLDLRFALLSPPSLDTVLELALSDWVRPVARQ